MIIKTIKKYIFPILVVLGGIIDLTTNLFKDFFVYMDIPLWVSVGIRVLLALCAAARLYYTITSIEKNTCDKEKEG
jgi:hypothetical protein